MQGGKVFVFFGIIGSGKGTQIDLLRNVLRDKYSIESVYAYPGSEYRRLIEEGSYIGSVVKESMSRGELQPDLLTTTLVMNVLINDFTPEKALFFDGYPRTVEQAKSFETILKTFKLQDVEIVYIEVGKEEAKKRNLQRGRHDDTEEGIAKRFDEYVNNVLPAMDYLKENAGYKIHKINGEQTIEEVQSSIIKSLNL